MLNRCTVCGRNLGAYHGNSKYCYSCRPKRHKFNTEPVVNTINVGINEFNRLHKQATKHQALVLASIFKYPVSRKGDTWVVRVNQKNVELLEWYEREVSDE